MALDVGNHRLAPRAPTGDFRALPSRAPRTLTLQPEGLWLQDLNVEISGGAAASALMNGLFKMVHASLYHIPYHTTRFFCGKIM